MPHRQRACAPFIIISSVIIIVLVMDASTLQEDYNVILEPKEKGRRQRRKTRGSVVHVYKVLQLLVSSLIV